MSHLTSTTMNGPDDLTEVFIKVLSDASEKELNQIEIDLESPAEPEMMPAFRPPFKRSRPQVYEPPTRDHVVDIINCFFQKECSEGITLEAANDLVDIVVNECAERCYDLDYDERDYILQRFKELCDDYRKKASALQEVLEMCKSKHAGPRAGTQSVRYKVTYNAVKGLVMNYCHVNYPGLFSENTINDITAKCFQIFKVMTFESMDVFQSMTRRVISDVTDKIAVVMQATMKGVPMKIEFDKSDKNFVHVKVPSEHMPGLIKSCNDCNIRFVEIKPASDSALSEKSQAAAGSTLEKCQSVDGSVLEKCQAMASPALEKCQAVAGPALEKCQAVAGPTLVHQAAVTAPTLVKTPLNLGIIQRFQKHYFVIPENRNLTEFFMLRGLEQETFAKVWESKQSTPLLFFQEWDFRSVGHNISYSVFNYVQNELLYRIGYLMTKCRTDVIAKIETGQLKQLRMSKEQLEKCLDKCWDDFCENIEDMMTSEKNFPVKVQRLKGK